MTDNKKSVHSNAEVVQLTNLLNEQIEVLDAGFDEQMDLEEPGQGLYDELFNQNDGAFTYPAKYVDSLFKERIPDVQKRLDEGTMRMNMNSQKHFYQLSILKIVIEKCFYLRL